jgi:hypothetical protein
MPRLRCFFLSALAAWIALGSSLAFAAPPKVERFFPPGAQRGQTTTVSATGSFANWPVRGWADRPGIEVSAAEEKGKLTVRIAPDAAAGRAWIRLYDDEGASAPRSFVIGTLPEVVETEPNDDFRKPQLLPSSALVVNGQLGKAGDVDTFAVSLQKGQTLVASVDAHRTLGSPMDASLQIVSSSGFVLEQNDDYHDLDPQIIFRVPADGTFLVRVFAFPATANSTIGFAGGADYLYRLTLTTGGFAEHAYPLAVPHAEPGRVQLVGWNIPDAAREAAVEPGPAGDVVTLFHADIASTVSVRREANATAVVQVPNDAEHPQAITLPVTVTGRLDKPRAVHAFGFHAAKGENLIFRVESRALGFPADPLLRVTDSAGKSLVEVDDSSTGDRDPELAFAVPADGDYRLLVRDLHAMGGDRYVYRLRAALAEPDYALKVAADSFVVTPGKPLEIPVTVDRTPRGERGGGSGRGGRGNRGGDRGSPGAPFNEEIEITASGLPEGVSVGPVKSLASGDTAKSVTLNLSAAKGPFSVPLRIVGTSAGEPRRSRSAVATIPDSTATTPDLWLTVRPNP